MEYMGIVGSAKQVVYSERVILLNPINTATNAHIVNPLGN